MSVTIGGLIDELLDAAKSAGISTSTVQLLAGSSPYTLAQLHRAIMFVLDDFVRETKCTRLISSLTLTASTATVSFASLTGFDPERIIGSGIRVTADSNYLYSDPNVVNGITVVGPEDIAREKYRSGTDVGVPTLLAFDTFTSGFPSSATVYRTPEFTGTAKVEWSPPLTTYNATVAAVITPGDTGVSAYTTNVRDDMAKKAVRTGGVVYLQNHQLENVTMTNPLKAAYVDHINASRGRGNLGVKTIQRESVRDLRGRGW